MRTQQKMIWHQEQRKKQHARCNVVFGKCRMKAIDRVKLREGSDLVQVTTQAALEAAIMRENTGRFKLACSSPFLRGDLLEQLGMSREGPLAHDILHHQGFLALHPSVRDLLSLFDNSPHAPISSFITPEEWVHHWKSVDERTASSCLGLHCGHCKARALMPKLAAIKCRLVNLALTNGVPLSRWSKGVSVILEKSPGSTNEQKLQAILLVEADFNAMHKIIFNRRVMPRLDVHNEITCEITGGRRNQSAMHLALNKKLIADIVNVQKLPTVTICDDATNYYDQVAHLFASLCAQYCGLNIEYLSVLFVITQNMKMFLRTSHGMSSCFYSGDATQPFQGMVQGNGATLPIWLIILIFLVRYLCNKNVVTHLMTPISRLAVAITALICVDKTDLHVFNNVHSNTEEITQKV